MVVSNAGTRNVFETYANFVPQYLVTYAVVNTGSFVKNWKIMFRNHGLAFIFLVVDGVSVLDSLIVGLE